MVQRWPKGQHLVKTTLCRQKSRTLDVPNFHNNGLVTARPHHSPNVFQIKELPLPPVFRYNFNEGVDFLPTLYSPFVPTRKNSVIMTGDARNATLSKLIKTDHPMRRFSPQRRSDKRHRDSINSNSPKAEPGHNDSYILLPPETLQATGSSLQATMRDRTLDLSEHFKSRINRLFKAKRNKLEEFKKKEEDERKRRGEQKNRQGTQLQGLLGQRKSIIPGYTLEEQRERVKKIVHEQKLREQARYTKKPMVPLITLSIDLRKRDQTEQVQVQLPYIRRKSMVPSVEVCDLRPWTNHLQNEDV